MTENEMLHCEFLMFAEDQVREIMSRADDICGRGVMDGPTSSVDVAFSLLSAIVGTFQAAAMAAPQNAADIERFEGDHAMFVRDMRMISSAVRSALWDADDANAPQGARVH